MASNVISNAYSSVNILDIDLSQLFLVLASILQKDQLQPSDKSLPRTLNYDLICRCDWHIVCLESGLIIPIS